MVPLVLCFGVWFLCCLNLTYVFISYLCSGNCAAAYWEIVAHSAYDVCSDYGYLVVNLVIPISAFGVGISF